ncbi:MAG: aminotransferase class I/II-fold pyridoxal phosphate-dependent enzyme [Clostridia bacterium]|nr:aminotransferase class I/II-fold pyridoxal phosphate-dependent enzyme [Clostridia bacterium]
MERSFLQMTRANLEAEKAGLTEIYEEKKAQGLRLDMSRGKPCREQLDLSNGLLTVLDGENCKADDGTDVRNYGILAGIPQARRLFAELCGVSAENVIIGGTASLDLMYSALVRAMLFGVGDGKKPWSQQGNIKFLCPCPGYDRHFAMCADLGIELIPVRMTQSGPDMDTVERLVCGDAQIKGIWCVPKYSNPDGITYSDDTVRRLARLRTAADDFRIFWDNAYIVHDIDDTPDTLTNIFDLIDGTPNSDSVYMFVSTAKITFPGAGISAMISSGKNTEFTLKHLTYQTISYDKINQLRHVRFLRDADGVRAHMKKHRAILEPKFRIVTEALERDLGGTDTARWNTPHGGYFISLYAMPGTAKRVGQLCREAGVTLTNVGATYPYGIDPDDSNIRIAPSYPSESELSAAVDILTVCVRLAACEKLLNE